MIKIIERIWIISLVITIIAMIIAGILSLIPSLRELEGLINIMLCILLGSGTTHAITMVVLSFIYNKEFRD